jgi:hypothetical protein
MPRKVFITLVSEQAVPNVLYIKEFQTIDAYLFVSTKFTETKNGANAIIDACDLASEKCRNIIVNEESLNDITTKIKKELSTNPLFEAAEAYIINCTLGNKIMSIALYEIFKDNPKARILYTPIGENKYKEIGGKEVETIFETKITIEQYFKSYNIGITKTGNCFKNDTYTQAFFEKYLVFDTNDYNVLEQLRERESPINIKKKIIGRDSGVANTTDIQGLSDFLNKISFQPTTENKLSKYEVIYLTGGWFEEYTYTKIKTTLGLTPDFIIIGLESKLAAGNDLDVVFIYANDLYIIECKTALGKDLQQPTLYKSGALVDKFGRAAKSYLFTLSDLRENGNLKPAIADRAKQQNVTVIDRHSIVSEFDAFIKKIIK